MSDSKPLIVARDLTKVYRLYERPQQRILDILGLLRRHDLPEHRALDGISFDIRAGERIGIIGRNGAGKSTLLKLISGVIRPTSGTLDVRGSARALLELGTGFHPEFTGRQNAAAYLAQLGISGREAAAKLDEIVEFAELEEYIDQPMKTYSSGMGVRLMFATSTAVTPELLILDEVLGVGDAYFTRKSFERIQEMCRRDNATLLLVSHDIYTSSRICDRMLWIEQGRILFDGEPHEAMKAYEDSIRLQEEERLRRKSRTRSTRTTADPEPALFIELATADRLAPPSDIYFGAVAVVDGTGTTLAMVHPADPNAEAALDHEASSWGAPTEWNGRAAVPMRTYGSLFHKVALTLRSAEMAQLLDHSAALRVEHGADLPYSLVARCYLGSQLVLAAEMRPSVGAWGETTLPFGHTAAATKVVPSLTGRFGNGAVEIMEARLLDAQGTATHIVQHGAPCAIEFDYRVHDPAIEGPLDVNLGIQRDGVDTVCRIFSRSLRFAHAGGALATVRVDVERLGLGAGEYGLNVLVAREGYFNDAHQRFFTINPDVLGSVHGILSFSVQSDGVISVGTAWVAEGIWHSNRSRSTS